MRYFLSFFALSLLGLAAFGNEWRIPEMSTLSGKPLQTLPRFSSMVQAPSMTSLPNPAQNVFMPPRKIIVDIATQTLTLLQDDIPLKVYPVSTSKYGEGSEAGSHKTPLGKHHIVRKIGEGAPELTIFKARQNTNELAVLNDSNAGDLVTTRIMWLGGLEPGFNSGEGMDSYQRYIYIHGTAEEKFIGQKASHGCIRMYNRDVIALFQQVGEGTPVDIRLGEMPEQPAYPEYPAHTQPAPQPASPQTPSPPTPVPFIPPQELF